MNAPPEDFSVKTEVLHSEKDKEEIKRRLSLGLPITLVFEVHTVQ